MGFATNLSLSIYPFSLALECSLVDLKLPYALTEIGSRPLYSDRDYAQSPGICDRLRLNYFCQLVIILKIEQA